MIKIIMECRLIYESYFLLLIFNLQNMKLEIFGKEKYFKDEYVYKYPSSKLNHVVMDYVNNKILGHN
jgi:hypothetical protein